MCLTFFRAGAGHIVVQTALCWGDVLCILAPAHEIMTGPDRDSQKCLQTLPSILSEAEWPPDENKRDFDFLLVIPDSLPSLEHLWGKKSQQGSSWPGEGPWPCPRPRGPPRGRVRVPAGLPAAVFASPRASPWPCSRPRGPPQGRYARDPSLTAGGPCRQDSRFFSASNVLESPSLF